MSVCCLCRVGGRRSPGFSSHSDGCGGLLGVGLESKLCDGTHTNNTTTSIVDRLARPNADGLHMKTEDFEALDLHAATLPSIQRVTTECSFWNPRKDTLCKSMDAYYSSPAENPTQLRPQDCRYCFQLLGKPATSL